MSLQNIDNLINNFDGEICTDELSKIIYSTDASVYREIPLFIAYPKSKNDLKKLILFAKNNHTNIIPRAAGTSLAGQVIGNGIVVDFSKHFNKIIDLNADEKWVKVQPGVVLDELNIFLKQSELFFAPETSTSNRCNIGGMLGNNACGSHSLIYGSTRDHVLSISAILSDGSEVIFKDLSIEDFNAKYNQNNIEGTIYKCFNEILSDNENKKEIISQYPHKDLKRRNTGYALDYLLDTEIFSDTDKKFNVCKLLAGSEGTLCFFTEIKLNLIPLPPKHKALICSHHNSITEALEANIIMLKQNPAAIELMDKTILDQTKNNILQTKNRFFIQDDPKAILITEFYANSDVELNIFCQNAINILKENNLGFHYPIIKGEDISKVWALRKAGLGVLSNIPGDAKPVAVIEDTAVIPEFLSDYIQDVNQALSNNGLSCVYYAHVATGELHLRPVLNLKKKEDIIKFKKIAYEIAHIVKKYKGSISGEHGDGILRSELIRIALGDKIVDLLGKIKKAFDPDNIFNPNKIVNPALMDENFRYSEKDNIFNIKTIFRFENTDNILNAVEQCNGSADCRKSALIGGLMCPSYMATLNEKNTTRARANTLREFLTKSEEKNPFNHKEIYDIMNECISCKGCKNECPSNVDITKYKAEFLFQWYKNNFVGIRSLLIANISKINKLGQVIPSVFNFFVKNPIISKLLKSTIGFASQRNIPTLEKQNFLKWFKNYSQVIANNKNRNVFLFIDEFTNYNDKKIGIACVKSLNKLGFKVEYIPHYESGRAYFSKGLLNEAKKLANKNVSLFSKHINYEQPLIGIEPSAILSFRDEYPSIVDENLIEKANELKSNCLLFEEFISRCIDENLIDNNIFTDETKTIKLHAHCYQKAIASPQNTINILKLPKNYHVEEIKSGCCGMAGSFGYEKEHFNLSMKIGDLALFPAIRKSEPNTIIAANGTSCRTQIKDGTNVDALHPIEIFYNSLK